MNGIIFVRCVLFVTVVCLASPIAGFAQPSPSERADEALADPPAAASTAQESGATTSLPWLELMVRGGWLMVPITLMSVIVVAVAVERAIALRRSRLLPNRLVRELKQMAEEQALEPQQLHKLGRQYPSVLARIVEAMLMKLGRTSSEIEHAISEASQREADRMYAPVRTLNLASTVTPLLGLLGTVQGMIQAFFVTANLAVGANKAEALAEGIYVALVTTFAGLSVAIPASVLAHLFESRILRLLREIEQIAAGLLPQVEHAEGPLRMHVHQTSDHARVDVSQGIAKSKAS